jgi:glycosyltransferase involved in cell wall biosynthesis
MSSTLPTISVIIAVYKKPRELGFVLESLAQQTHLPEEVIIAEDNLSTDISAVIEQFTHRFPSIKHVNQENKGFGKCKILNKAIAQSTQSLLFFTDGDCLFRKDFIYHHKRLAKPGQFVTGGGHIDIHSEYHLNTDLMPSIINQSLFTERFFRQEKCGVIKPLRLSCPSLLKPLLNAFTNRNALVGCNAAVWKADAITVAGFDEVMGYGSEDLNMGIRLNNIGIVGKRYNYCLPHLHLNHSRGYVDKAISDENNRHNSTIKKTSVSLPRQSSLLNRLTQH